MILPTVNFDNNQHEENENLRLGQFFQAIEIIAIVHSRLSFAMASIDLNSDIGESFGRVVARSGRRR